MKCLFTILQLCIVINLCGQGFDQKRIGFRRDDFLNNNWVGIDSSVWQYNANGDSLFKESTKFSNNVWTPLQRTFFNYGTNGKVSDYVRQSYINNAWVNGSKLESIYDINDNQITQNGYSWVNNTWFLNKRANYIYSPSNKVKQEFFEVFDNGQWNNAAITTYTYDVVSDLLNEKRAAVWNNNLWSNVSRNIYYWFNPQKPLILEEYEGKQDTLWRKKRFTKNFYANQQLIKTEIQKDSNWAFYSKDSFAYANTNVIVPDYKITSLADTNGVWFINSKETYLYNTDTNISKLEVFNWLNNAAYILDSSVTNYYTNKNLTGQYKNKYSAGNLTAQFRDTLEYNSNNLITYQLTQEKLNTWINKRQYFHYYNQHPLNVNLLPSKQALIIFPNPSTSEITLSVPVNSINDANIFIYKDNGQLIQSIATPIIDAKVKLPVHEWQVGYYTIQVQVSNKVYTCKFLKN
jgi:hypothetical protein